MPEEGTYLLTHAGFSRDEKPRLLLRKGEALIDFYVLGQTFTLTFDTSQRFCIGWYDLAKSENHPCPETAATSDKYDQCTACQKRTGFNPAFYHAASVSPQQEARNAEPHILYLAHFAPGLVKVGISYAGRGKARLLEQGARSALILDTFPTAAIARQYEAKIAAMPGIAETMLLGKKIATLSQLYNAEAAEQELRAVQTNLEDILKVSFSDAKFHTFDAAYFPTSAPNLAEAHDTTPDKLLSGQCIGMMGSLLFCDYEGMPVFCAAKKFTGYCVTLSHHARELQLPARQISLF